MGGLGVGARGGQYSRRGNLQKYENRNPLQRGLIWYFHRRVAKVVEASRPRSILDVGCGEGFTIDWLLRVNGQLPIQGVDYDWPALVHARVKHPEVPFQMGDISRLPYASGSFDLVLCLEVLEHLAEPIRALGELRRVSGGLCLISVPNEPFFMMSNFLRGKNVRGWGNDPEHLHRWTAGESLRLLGEHFRVESVAYPFPWVLALCRT
ncbi:MAG TPA: class I SAM-dependent methyltransferase [Anaerolineae bacterium]|nr:class I SAM-dependent methyltransferase [Anaerolineae bacterium]